MTAGCVRPGRRWPLSLRCSGYDLLVHLVRQAIVRVGLLLYALSMFIALLYILQSSPHTPSLLIIRAAPDSASRPARTPALLTARSPAQLPSSYSRGSLAASASKVHPATPRPRPPPLLLSARAACGGRRAAAARRGAALDGGGPRERRHGTSAPLFPRSFLSVHCPALSPHPPSFRAAPPR